MTETIRAAGGVVLRRDADGTKRVAIVHRPKYDDWSLPKGKLDAGETWEAAALREVQEETGLRCLLVRECGETRYLDGKSRSKIARYWLMEPLDGRFSPNDEVDELRWVGIDEAILLLSHRHDGVLLERALEDEGSMA